VRPFPPNHQAKPSRAEAAMTLCRQCGLCCDGTLFAWLAVGPAELPALQAHGLPVLQRADGSRALRQPCAALCGKDCTAYEARPLPCRQFRCQQLIALDEGEIDLPEALRVVQRTQQAIAELVPVGPAATPTETSETPSRPRLNPVAAVGAAQEHGPDGTSGAEQRLNLTAPAEAARPINLTAPAEAARPINLSAPVEAARPVNPVAALRAQVAASSAPPDRAEALRRIEALLARDFLGRTRRA